MLHKKINAKTVFIFLTISFFSFSLDAKIFSGNIVFPQEIVPMIRLYYKGKCLSLDENSKEYKKISFSFDEKSSVHELNILICEQVSCYAYHNNIRYLTVASDKYKFYNLQGTRAGDILSWEISEEQLDEKHIPDNTLIFMFDPDLVQGLRSVSWKKENQMRLLPEIIMDSTVPAEIFAQAMTVACLSAMDMDLCHEKSNARSMQGNRVVAKLSNNIHNPGTKRVRLV